MGKNTINVLVYKVLTCNKMWKQSLVFFFVPPWKNHANHKKFKQMTPSDLGQIKTKNPFDPTSLGYA
jgi:hypothetical protein